MFFGINNANFLKFFYNALLTGMPSLTYNPFNKNILHSPFNVNEYSTYINYRLNSILEKDSFTVTSQKNSGRWYGFCILNSGEHISIAGLLIIATILD